MKTEKFLIAGCDKKMQECKNRLIDSGHIAECLEGDAFRDNVAAFRNIILPLPSISNGIISSTGINIEYLNSCLNERQRVFYGNIENNPFGSRGFSYYYNEAFLIKNSRLTAQGVARLVLENTEKDFFELKIAVVGYGRCGKSISKMLRKMGADVTAYSRSNISKTKALNDGIRHSYINQFNTAISKYDIIVNTVPFNIISSTGLETLTKENLYVETASKPYGFSIADADIYNFRYILASGLPGKYTPVSAGENIADTVIEILKEGNYG